MTPQGIREQFAAVIRRHWRDLSDTGGVPPQALLDDLGQIAQRYAEEIVPDGFIRINGELTQEQLADVERNLAEYVRPAAKTAPRRRTARKEG